MNLIFEKSKEGRGTDLLPNCDVDSVTLSSENKREKTLNLPQIAEIDIMRHYTELANRTHGVNDGFYPLGSCTMKYSPKINDEMSSLSGFSQLHPLQPIETVQGALEALTIAEQYLCEITGMDAMTFQPAAGAHGELAGIMLIKAYHKSRGDKKRTKIIVPDAAHGTNPATASMCGYTVVNIPSNDEGCVDLDKLKEVMGDDVAGLMLTNPNTVGIFDKNVLEITQIVHNAGGLVYYDGANLNAIMGVVRPGDMGFDVIHLNLHKTFSAPHGGGGPGAGPVGCKEILKPFLPKFYAVKGKNGYEFKNAEQTIGSLKAFYGNFAVVLKALTYIVTLGAGGIKEAAENAVLNANYMRVMLKELYDVAFDGICMHEFVLSLEKMKKEHGVTAMDIAKSLLDYGMHPPTMYFPLIVHEALMIEPTETESKETLDKAVDVFKEIYETALKDPKRLHDAPTTTVVGRLDEVNAARNPKLRYHFNS